MNGMIHLGGKFAKEIGFTSKLFSGYLWKDDKNIWISLIESKNEGQKNLSKLFNKIEELGYKVVVPTALRKMELICLGRDMKKVLVEVDDEIVECYVKNKMIQLKCEICGIDYEKIDLFLKMKDKNIFFEMNLKYCDECRRKKEVKALERIPDIIRALTNKK